MRMDRYEEKKDEEKDNEVLSRTTKNQKMYNDVYMNSSYVDINKILDVDESNNEEKEIDEDQPKESYEEKNYSVVDYLAKAHEKYHPDNDIRSLSNKEFIDGEDEISKLIKEIDEKEENDEFFSDLMGENEDTMGEGQLIKDEIEEVTHKEIFSTTFFEDEAKLEKALGSETMTELKLEEEGISNTFQDIMRNDRMSKKKNSNYFLFYNFIRINYSYINYCI